MGITSTSKEKLKRLEETERALAANELAQEIIRLRNLAGWSQAELAQRVGLHQTMISDIEKGKHSFPLDTVVRLARAFDENPFRFASIYWGLESFPFTQKERQLFDSLISMVSNYLNPNPRLDQSYLDIANQVRKELEDKADKKKVEPNHEHDDGTGQ